MPISVVVVSWNSAPSLRRTLDSVAQQEGIDVELVVVDNASTDGSADCALGHPAVNRLIRNTGNEGFAAGHNRGIGATSGDLVACVNPDVVLRPDFLVRLVARLREPYGFATGKLLRGDATSGASLGTIDSAGLFFLRNRRHVDRGAGERDDRRYDEPGDTFGATGAALVARRDALDDITPPGHDGPFDSAFFAYREDADLAWRAQLLGWRCWYEPTAVATHVRGLRPDQRRAHIDPVVNMHSVKNRYLMLIKNEHWLSLRPDVAPFLLREVLITGGVLLREHRSLRAYPLLARHLPRARRDRRWIASRRVVEPAELRRRMFLP